MTFAVYQVGFAVLQYVLLAVSIGMSIYQASRKRAKPRDGDAPRANPQRRDHPIPFYAGQRLVTPPERLDPPHRLVHPVLSLGEPPMLSAPRRSGTTPVREARRGGDHELPCAGKGGCASSAGPNSGTSGLLSAVGVADGELGIAPGPSSERVRLVGAAHRTLTARGRRFRRARARSR